MYPWRRYTAVGLTFRGHFAGDEYAVYRNNRFPPQVIARAVWLYFGFPLNLRLVDEMLLERGAGLNELPLALNADAVRTM